MRLEGHQASSNRACKALLVVATVWNDCQLHISNIPCWSAMQAQSHDGHACLTVRAVQLPVLSKQVFAYWCSPAPGSTFLDVKACTIHLKPALLSSVVSCGHVCQSCLHRKFRHATFDIGAFCIVLCCAQVAIPLYHTPAQLILQR